jgi:hypothetical protein
VRKSQNIIAVRKSQNIIAVRKSQSIIAVRKSQSTIAVRKSQSIIVVRKSQSIIAVRKRLINRALANPTIVLIIMNLSTTVTFICLYLSSPLPIGDQVYKSKPVRRISSFPNG